MTKISTKLKQKIANSLKPIVLKPIVLKASEELYNQLYVVVNYMNIDIKSLFESSTNYDQFWQIVADYYNDYTMNVEEDN